MLIFLGLRSSDLLEHIATGGCSPHETCCALSSTGLPLSGSLSVTLMNFFIVAGGRRGGCPVR